MGFGGKVLEIIARLNPRGVEQGTKKAEGSIKSFSSSAKSLLAGVGVTFGVAVAGRFVLESAKMAAVARDSELAFRGVAGGADEARKLLDAMRDASRGAISDLTLMRSASRAAFFGVPIERVPDLLKTARTAAIATGQEFSFMLESLVLGLGRQSPMILDNLGLTVKLGTATQRYADKIGKASGALTDQERKLALLDEIMRQNERQQRALGDAIDESTGSEKIQSLAAEWSNLRVEFGKLVDVPLATFFHGLAEAIGSIDKEKLENLLVPEADEAELSPTAAERKIGEAWAGGGFGYAYLPGYGPIGRGTLHGYQFEGARLEGMQRHRQQQIRAAEEAEEAARQAAFSAEVGGYGLGRGFRMPSPRFAGRRGLDEDFAGGASKRYAEEIERDLQRIFQDKRNEEMVAQFFARGIDWGLRDGLRGVLSFFEQELRRAVARSLAKSLAGSLSGDFNRVLSGALR